MDAGSVIEWNRLCSGIDKVLWRFHHNVKNFLVFRGRIWYMVRLPLREKLHANLKLAVLCSSTPHLSARSRRRFHIRTIWLWRGLIYGDSFSFAFIPPLDVHGWETATKAYHLASEFPYFLQEAFPNLRFKPKSRMHPKKFFGADTAASAGWSAQTMTFIARRLRTSSRKREGKIFPQGVRFRVFAYVYDDESDKLQTPAKSVRGHGRMADITWKVNIANKKSEKSTDTDPHENSRPHPPTSTRRTLASSANESARSPVFPILAYIFLERDDGDKNKVTGRLHVIGNEGEFVRPRAGRSARSLWSDDWYDSAGDGSVQAIVSPRKAIAAFRSPERRASTI